ncbi:MAG TPA: carboxylesterase family protein [Thermodesulfobacteriota bacterium]|nr:carboxylesterase family protein [Thermodesulfobacteriota bacterium]
MKKTNWKIFLGIVFLVFLGLVFTSSMVNAQVLPTVTIASPIDALNTLYTYVHGLSTSAFVKPQYQKTVLSMINSTIKQTQSGAYYQASLKLYTLWDNVDTWIKAGDSDQTLMGDIDAAFIAILDAEQTTVGTLYGLVSGADAGNDCWVWAGIPYAKPPVGALRWKAPQDPKPWSGIRPSTISFSPAWQPDMSALWLPQGPPIGSEDCLYLNIFRPKDADPGSNLPVFIWIHGGGNVFGEANIYNASLLASKENMIVVVIQYRLGPFGFFYFPALNPSGTAEDKSGNYGTLDTIKAVKWVKHNIRFFGGNPQNITVGGQSAGGFNTLTLLTSPLANGLFQKAFVMSAGGGALPPDKSPAYRIANWLLGGDPNSTTPPAGWSDTKIATLLRSVPALGIEAALMDKNTGSLALGIFNPSIDGTVIAGTFADRISTGDYSKIPIMIGNTEYETKPFLPLYVWLGGVFNLTTTPASGFVFDPNQTTFDAIWTTVNGPPYNAALPSDLYQAAGLYAALDWKAVMVDELATSMVTNNQNDVYAYQFIWGGVDTPPSDNSWSDPDSDSTGLAFLYGAGHATDIPFFFGWDIDVYSLPSKVYPPLGLGLFNSANQGGRVALQQAMMSYLGNFVHTGNPNGTGLTQWDTWSNTGGENTYIVLDATPTDANIGMTTGSYTDAGVVAAVNALSLPDAAKALILGFFSFSPIVHGP